MFKKICWLLGIMVGFSSLIMTQTAYAEKNHFTVHPEFPSNQLNGENSYYELKMEPGQEQTIYVDIHNGDQVQHTYDVITSLATTANNGTINYHTSDDDKVDSSLGFNIAEATTNSKNVKVKANSTKKVGITIEMPKKAYKGVALGGISIRQQVKKQGGIQNQFGYTIALKLQEEDELTVEPDMKLLYAGPRKLNERERIVAQLQNPKAAIMRELKVTSYVTKAGSSKKLLKTSKEELKMAPNSNFNYALGDGVEKLAPGKYTLHLKADSEKGKYKWNFKKEFTISAAKAQQMNKLTIGKPVKTINWWLIGGMGAVILALIGWIIWLLRTRRKSN